MGGLCGAALVALAACGESEPDADRGAAGDPAYAVDLGARGASFDRAGWRTDFAHRTVPLAEIYRGGPGRDDIPPLDRPGAVSRRLAARELGQRDPVIAVAVGRAARAYPLRTLVWHEVVNDRLGGRPIAVTYSPLTDSSLVLDRRVEGRELRLGTTGNLRRSNPLLWDRATESWWQQMTGEATVGSLAGRRLRPMPVQTLSFAMFGRRFPRGDVLARPRGSRASYTRNPYLGYDRLQTAPHLFRGRVDGRLPPKERVVVLPGARPPVAVPFARLVRRRVAHLELGGTPAVVLYERGVASAIDADSVARSRDVGTAAAFDRRLDQQPLTFARRDGAFVDRETGSRWDVTGRAVAGPLRGRRLRRLRHEQAFWFAAAAFRPRLRVAAATGSHSIDRLGGTVAPAPRATPRAEARRPPRRATRPGWEGGT